MADFVPLYDESPGVTLMTNLLVLHLLGHKA